MRLRARTAQVTWREAGGKVVILDLQGSVYLSLNESGSLLWRRLNEPEPVDRDGLVSTVVEAYGIERDQAGHDVDAFLAQLEEHQLLDW